MGRRLRTSRTELLGCSSCREKMSSCFVSEVNHGHNRHTTFVPFEERLPGYRPNPVCLSVPTRGNSPEDPAEGQNEHGRHCNGRFRHDRQGLELQYDQSKLHAHLHTHTHKHTKVLLCTLSSDPHNCLACLHPTLPCCTPASLHAHLKHTRTLTFCVAADVVSSRVLSAARDWRITFP